MKANPDRKFESFLPQMNWRTRWAMIVIGLGMIAMMAVPDRDPIPTPADQLRQAAVHGDIMLVDAAIKQGAGVNARDDVGMTPLIEAARAGHLDTCDRLLRAGADVNAVSPAFGTALIQASFYGHTEIVRLLLNAGANPTLRSQCGITAMQNAVSGRHFDIARELLLVPNPARQS